MRLIEKLEKPETLSEISRDMGQVFFASVLVDPVVNGSISGQLFFGGLTLSLFSWILSLLLSKE